MSGPDHTCGACGAPMVMREVAPCLDCGGGDRELDDLRAGYHKYSHLALFDGDILCDFCDADMPSTDPLFWGFPRDFDWGSALAREKYDYFTAPTQGNQELACSKCYNTLRKQTFVARNAKRHGVALPKEYWGYITMEA